MEILVKTNVEARKEWVAPELKKIDVEELTAFGTVGAADGFAVGS